MNEDGPGEIPTPLKGLRKVKAPDRIEVLLRQQLHSLPAKNRWAGWLIRPAPLVLMIGGTVLVAFIFLMDPFGVHTGPAPQMEAPRGPVPAALAADSVTVDSITVVKTDVNTSKLP